MMNRLGFGFFLLNTPGCLGYELGSGGSGELTFKPVPSGSLSPVPKTLTPACISPPSAGYRIRELTYEASTGPKTLNVAIWYPTNTPASSYVYDQDATMTGQGVAATGKVALEAAPQKCKPLPVVVFSHGLNGCGLQSIFFTEELARHGYVVIATDHDDAAACAIKGAANSPSAGGVFNPSTWTEASYLDRHEDIDALLSWVGAEASDPESEWVGVFDAQRIALTGHSLGGYTTLATVGAWRTWYDERVDVAVVLSGYTQPFQIQPYGTIPDIDVPVMYQGGTTDTGITPSLKGNERFPGAYNLTTSSKVFLEIERANHYQWSNSACASYVDVATCIASDQNVQLINRYAIGYLDKHLRQSTTADEVLFPAATLAGIATYWWSRDGQACGVCEDGVACSIAGEGKC